MCRHPNESNGGIQGGEKPVFLSSFNAKTRNDPTKPSVSAEGDGADVQGEQRCAAVPCHAL